MDNSEAEKQRKFKYRDHDVCVEDLSELELLIIKGNAVKEFVTERESDQVKLIIASFLGHLTTKGYKIIKKEHK